MFQIGDTVEVDYEAIPSVATRRSYRDWMGSRTTLTVGCLRRGTSFGGADELGFVECNDDYPCRYANYFKLAGPPRTVRALSMKIVRELTQ